MKSSWLSLKRKSLNLSQEELVARLQIEGVEVSRGMLSHWETGRNDMPLNDPVFVKALAHALRLTVLDVLIFSGYEIQTSPRTEEASRAANIVDQLPEDQRSLAIGLLEQLLASARK